MSRWDLNNLKIEEDGRYVGRVFFVQAECRVEMVERRAMVLPGIGASRQEYERLEED